MMEMLRCTKLFRCSSGNSDSSAVPNATSQSASGNRRQRQAAPTLRTAPSVTQTFAIEEEDENGGRGGVGRRKKLRISEVGRQRVLREEEGGEETESML